MVLYIEQPIISSSVDFSIRDIFSPIMCLLLNKLRDTLHESLASLIKCFIVDSKHVDLETPVLISSSSDMYGDSNIEQVIAVIINFNQHFFQ